MFVRYITLLWLNLTLVCAVFSHDKISELSWYEPVELDPIIECLRNDTIFCYQLHLDSEKKSVDSVTLNGCAIRYKQKKWMKLFDDGSYYIAKYKRIQPSAWFSKYNDSFFHAEFEVTCKYCIRYDSLGKMEFKLLRVGRLVWSRVYNSSYQ